MGLDGIKDAYATAIGHGDPVALGTSGNAGYIILAAEASTPVGILRGVRYIDSTGQMQFRPNFPAGTSNSGLVSTVAAAGGASGDIVALVEPVENRTFMVNTADAAATQADLLISKRFKNIGTVDSLGYSTIALDMDAAVDAEVLLGRIVRLPQDYVAGGLVEVEFVNTL
jgi:hypothetical protein